MTRNNATTVESIENIEAGDVLTIERKGEVIADEIEVTELETGGLGGIPEPQTDGELEWGSDLFGVLAEALGENSAFSQHFEVYKIEDNAESIELGGQEVSEGDTVEQDGERWVVDGIEDREKELLAAANKTETYITATRQSDGETVTHRADTLTGAFEDGTCTVL